jgi:hypothetical protein
MFFSKTITVEKGVIKRGLQSPGSHEYVFDGSGLPSGVYLYRVSVGSGVWTGRMLLMK